MSAPWIKIYFANSNLFVSIFIHEIRWLIPEFTRAKKKALKCETKQEITYD